MPQAIAGPIADSGIPTATTFQFPSMVNTSQAIFQGQSPNLPPFMTPETMLARMPTIVQPVVVDVTPPCSQGFQGWISENPMIAGITLALIAAWAWGARR